MSLILWRTENRMSVARRTIWKSQETRGEGGTGGLLTEKSHPALGHGGVSGQGPQAGFSAVPPTAGACSWGADGGPAVKWWRKP